MTSEEHLAEAERIAKFAGAWHTEDLTDEAFILIGILNALLAQKG